MKQLLRVQVETELEEMAPQKTKETRAETRPPELKSLQILVDVRSRAQRGESLYGPVVDHKRQAGLGLEAVFIHLEMREQTWPDMLSICLGSG